VTTDDLTRTRLSRRQILAGGAASVAVWTAPTVIGLDPVAAALGSCLPVTVNWTSRTQSGTTYTIGGTSGNISIQATIEAQLSTGANPQVSLSSGRILVAMSNHEIGDRFLVSFQFTAPPQTVTDVGLTVMDIDQNGRGLGCATNSRFRDEISSISGAGLSATPHGALVEAPIGTWASSIPCKTSNQENLDLAWSQPGGVVGTGMIWLAGTPPGNSLNLDRQIILISPVDVCVSGGAGGGAGLSALNGAAARTLGEDSFGAGAEAAD
jgi:hypothetical protein